MSEGPEQKPTETGNINLQIGQKYSESDGKKLNSSQINNINEELLAEDFDFFQDESEQINHLSNIEKGLEKIKATKENDLDEYLKDYIQDLEEFSCIFNLEELILSPEYTIKLFMKSLKKVINFQYFYTKFNNPKEKNENKEKFMSIKNKGNKENQIDNETSLNQEKINLSVQTKEQNNKIKKRKDNKQKDEKNNDMKKKEIEENNGKIEYKISNEGEKEKNKNKKLKDYTIENKEDKGKKCSLNNDEKSSEFMNKNKAKKDNLEKLKNDFISQLNIRESKGIFINLIKSNNNISNEIQDQNALKINNSAGEPQNKMTLSKFSKKEKNSIQKSEKSDTFKDETSSKLEEYKAMNYSSIISIINNYANIEEENFVEGKSYETKVRKYFQAVLDICSEKFLTVYKNNGTSIQSFYKYYEYIIGKDKNKINDNISSDFNKKQEYNKLEFDLMVDM